MTELYSPDELRRMHSCARICLILGIGIMVLTLACCVTLCFHVRPNNTKQILVTVILLSTLAGWCMILLINLGYLPAIAEARHIEHLNKGTETEYAGRISINKKQFKIPRSVNVNKVKVTEGEVSHSLSVNARKLRLLPPDGTRVRLKSMHGFITAFEVSNEQR